MRYFNRSILIVTILILVVTSIFGSIASNSAKASSTNPLLYPYNQSTSVTFNINDLTTAWTTYKNARLTTSGAQGGVRVLFDDGSSTVSEGMGYGMIFTVMFDEQANFDGMWKYVSQHLDANGLMNWKIDSAGSSSGGNGAATDGDEDMALALTFACTKTQKGAWPASPNGYNYCTLATNLINAIYNVEIDKPGSTPSAGLSNNPGNELLPGDTWSLSTTYPNGIVNLSYFSPGYYTVFGKFTGKTSQWEAVNTRQYAIANMAQAQSGNCSKLVPNWATYSGAPQIVSWETTGYDWWGWDAARFAWRVAVDKTWYNTTNARETMNEVGGFFSSVGISNVKAEYKLDGTSVDTYDSAFFSANAAAAIWAAPAPIAVNCGAATATLKSTPQQAYDRLLAINDTTSYYPAAWRVFGLMLLTGNFPNIYELGNSTQISTPTQTVGASPTRTNTPSSFTPTRTNTPNNFTPTRTPTLPAITNTPTRTSTPTSVGSGTTCTPVSSTITAPFTFDGAGTYCWQSSNLGSYINSWNATNVTLNGANVTNLYVASGSYPAKIGGYWYVSYNSSVAWGHFEAK